MNSDLKNVILFGSSVGLGLGLIWLGYSRFYRRRKPFVGAVVSALYFYPVKSCAGIDLSEVEVGKLGVHLDRQWVMVNAKRIFVSQRQIPKMALIQPSFEGENYLCLDAPGMPRVKINVDAEDGERNKEFIKIWDITCEAYSCGDEIDKWLCTFLGKTGLKLCSGYGKDLRRRKLNEDPFWADVAKEGDEVVFPDYGPTSLISEASLKAVNSHLQNPVTIKSFRPNIFVKGCGPYDEDSWTTILIGDVVLRKLRPCTRCVLTAVDLDTGRMRPNNEPFKTLKRTRLLADRDKRCEDRPLFGNHFAVDQIGKIKIGDEVMVLK